MFPFFHMAGIHLINIALSVGATLVTMPRYDLHLPALLQDCRATRASLPPPVLLELSRHPAVEDYDLSRLRRSVGRGTAERGDRPGVPRAPGLPVKQGYGLTEATPMHLVPAAGEDRPGSTGPAGAEHGDARSSTR